MWVCARVPVVEYSFALSIARQDFEGGENPGKKQEELLVRHGAAWAAQSKGIKAMRQEVS